MKKIVRKLPLYLWVSAFLLLLGCFFIGRQIIRQQDSTNTLHSISQTEQEMKDNLTNIEKQANYESKTIRPVDVEQIAQAQLNYETVVNQWSIGRLAIPDAAIHAPILAGMSDDNLIVGVGTMREKQRFGQGNYVALAHSLVDGGGTLGNLPQAGSGSLIYTTDFSKVYVYRVTKNLIIHETETSYIEEPQENDVPLLTLFRCEGGLDTEKRYLVQAEWQQTYALEEVESSILKQLGFNQDFSEEQPLSTTEKRKEAIPTDSSICSTEARVKETTTQAKQSNPKYSHFERFCMYIFLLINQHYLLIFGGYFVGFLFLSRFCK
ncbi:TPA: class A sortase [Enterococcus faecium]